MKLDTSSSRCWCVCPRSSIARPVLIQTSMDAKGVHKNVGTPTTCKPRQYTLHSFVATLAKVELQLVCLVQVKHPAGPRTLFRRAHAWRPPARAAASGSPREALQQDLRIAAWQHCSMAAIIASPYCIEKCLQRVRVAPNAILEELGRPRSTQIHGSQSYEWPSGPCSAPVPCSRFLRRQAPANPIISMPSASRWWQLQSSRRHYGCATQRGRQGQRP